MLFKRFITIGVAWLLFSTVHAQAPSWSVDANAYETSMTITAAIKIDHVFSNDKNDKVAAFVGNEVRGVATVSVDINDASKKLAFITVYSNSVGGENITFKLYDKSADKVITAITKVTFKKNENKGSISSPFIITDNNAPTDISLSKKIIAENSAIGIKVGKFSSEDGDTDDTFKYQLVSGTGSDDNEFFSITGADLKVKKNLNYETKSEYKVRIKSIDSQGGAYEKAFVISVTNSNDTPTAIALSKSEVLENKLKGTEVGKLSSTDEDISDTFSYSLVSGTGAINNASFVIEDNILKTREKFDYETNNSYQIRVKTTDNEGASFEKSFTIKILDGVDTPTKLSISKDEIKENLPVGSVIGVLSTTDQDAGDAFTYQILGFFDETSFVLDGNKLKTNAVFDFERKIFYKIEIQTKDQTGNLYKEVIAIEVLDANDVPKKATLDKNSVNENSVVGSKVGEFSTVDEDKKDKHTYSLVDTNKYPDNKLFSISGKALNTQSVFNYEEKNKYQIKVRTNDQNGGVIDSVYHISIVDTNDKPTDIALKPSSIQEEKKKGAVIGVFSTTDQDTNDTYTYSFTDKFGKNDNKSFVITGDKLIANESFDYEVKNEYEVQITSTDKGGLSFDKKIKVSILPVNEPPTIKNQSYEAKEDIKPLTEVGKVLASDTDKNTKFKFSIINPSAVPFAINENKGVLSLKKGSELDYEKQSSYQFEVIVKDELEASDTAIMKVTIIDIIERELPANNFVSDNNDGKNDFFKIVNVEMYIGYTLQIFDARKVEVYSDQSYKNDWHGQAKNGSQLPIGMYYFIFRNPQENFQYKGKITLIR